MELKLRKYIKNVKALPKFVNGLDSNGDLKRQLQSSSIYRLAPDFGSVATAAIGAGTSIYDSHLFTTTPDDYINKYGTTTSYINNIGYTRYNDIDRGNEMDIVRSLNHRNTLLTTGGGAAAGAAIGSIIPGIGTVVGGLVGAGVGALGGLIGGLFGSRSRKRKARQRLAEAQLKVDNYNDTNRSLAMTTGLLQDEASLYGDTRSLQLYGYKLGKDAVDPVTGNTIDDHVVETAEGATIDKQNSWVSEGEGIWNPSTGFANLVTHGKNDSARAKLEDGDVVFGSRINPITGNEFKQDAAPYIQMKQNLNKIKPKSKGWLGAQTISTWEKAAQPINDNIDSNLSNLAELQRSVSINNNLKENLPRFKGGGDYGLSWWSNAVPSAIGSIASLGQYFSAKKDTPYKPNTYTTNPYENRGLNELAGLRISSYPIIQQLRDAETRGRYTVAGSGGLSPAQKTIAMIANTNNTQQNIAQSLMSMQAQNNSYRSQYADALLKYGDANAARRQLAMQYDLDYYGKSHGARLQMMQMGMRNFLDYINQYSANEYKRRSAIAMLNQYEQKLNLDKQALLSNFPSEKQTSGKQNSPVRYVYLPMPDLDWSKGPQWDKLTK